MCIITKHAEKRMRKRLGLKRKAVLKVAEKALLEGRYHCDHNGKLKRYLDKTYLSHGNANNIRVFNGYLFLFQRETLITVYRLPPGISRLS